MFSSDLPKPILFHPLKHHLLYIRDFIKTSTSVAESELKKVLVTIGSSQLDLYLGQLTPRQISEEVMFQLKKQNLLQAQEFQQYLLSQGKEYYVVTLSDATAWILRWGMKKERFVHLHPARYTSNTERVKANSLKTAIATTMVAKRLPGTEINVELINKVRQRWLELPPIKVVSGDSGISRLVKLLKA